MNGKVVIGTELDTKSFDAQIRQVERELEILEKSADESNIPEQFRRSEDEAKQLQAEIEKTRNKLNDLNKKQTQLNQEQAQMGKLDLSGVQSGLNNVNKGLQNTVKKVAKWGLALFGIRTAYNAIRGAMSTLSQYDTQMADNIEYIRYSLASSLQPVIQTILNLVVRLLQYINYIAKAWTGKNLFKTADAFKSAQKSASGVAKSAKEINKQLAGFDEMNVLSDTSSSGAGGGGADITAPNIDLTGMQGEVPQWLKWIVDNKDLILAVMSGVATGLLAWKLGLTGIQSLGIGLAIAGIVFAIQSIIEYLQDPSWENFGKIITGIGVAVAGVAIIFGAWPVAIGAAIAAIIGIVVSNWDKIKETIQGAIDWVRKNFANLGGEVLKPLLSILPNAMQLMLDFVDNAINSAKNIFDGLIKFIKGVFTGDWKLAWEGIKQILKGVLDGFVNIMTTPIKAAWTIIKGVLQTLSNMIDGIFNKLRDGAQKAMNGIKSVFSGFASWLGGIFSNAWNKVKAVFSTGGKVFTGIKDGIVNAFKSIVNKLIDGINKVISIPFNKLNSTLKSIKNINILGEKPFKGLISTISVPKIPHLAKGGIINMPGRGVPVGEAIAGERGQEAVLPLTDSQQMELLGEAIGRYVNINLTNITKLDNRQIAKEQRKINAQNDFAFNR